MATKVVNVKVAYIRPQYNNLKEWMSDPNNVYIGRGRIVFIDGERYPPHDSPFANPYKVGKDGTREEVIAKYVAYMTAKIESSPLLYEQLRSMKGKNLGCWCAPDSCHGDILAYWIDNM